ncbi:MAG TPA: hypothetical protein VGF99_06515, partial [Myxococcota bacterium]
DDVKARLRTAIREAMRARDSDLVSVYRDTLAALDNAEAPAQSSTPKPAMSSPAVSSAVAGAVSGVGAGEVARLELSSADVAAVIEREGAERASSATQYEQLGRVAEAAVLRKQIAALSALLST